ncbi:ATP-binding protein [Arthrobacter sp. ISL-30]|uniref:ATP-binding protein n=1 Tax=Arthrobacter sp. ISL-30 TaxID=2819109 RepID=UPI0035B403BB
MGRRQGNRRHGRGSRHDLWALPSGRGCSGIPIRPGAGLGLAIVGSIAEAHQGTAWVCSKAGEGATFGLTIPAPDEQPVSPDEPAEEPRKDYP